MADATAVLAASPAAASAVAGAGGRTALPLGAARNAGCRAPECGRARVPRRRLHPDRDLVADYDAALATARAGSACGRVRYLRAGLGTTAASTARSRATATRLDRRRQAHRSTRTATSCSGHSTSPSGRRPGTPRRLRRRATAATAPRTPTSGCGRGRLGIPLLWVRRRRSPTTSGTRRPASTRAAPSRSSPTPGGSDGAGARGRCSGGSTSWPPSGVVRFDPDRDVLEVVR